MAIGDSLTEGVGDSSKQGGFVPILSRQLEQTYNYKVTSHNYGVAGNTSAQILKRMQTKSDIQATVQKADLMTVTVGGNDVITYLKKHFQDATVESFEKPAKTYRANVRKIIKLARKDNPDLPIYIIGIYNPFYLNFPEMTQMQDVVDNWNKGTEELTKDYQNVYFVPINDLLYKGIDGQEGVVEESQEQAQDQTEQSETVENDALYEGDHFHPNNIGYQIMSNAVMEEINDTKEKW